MAGLVGFLTQQFTIGSWEVSLLDIIFAVLLLVAGIILGKITKSILRNISEKAELARTVKMSFIHLFLTVAEWSVYILFINLALKQLQIPQLLSWLTNVLIVIPALVGALLLIAIGFIIASYLKDIIEESKVLNWDIMSRTVFYFVLYVFLLFALKTALISFDDTTVNIILIIFTAVISMGFTYKYTRKK